LIAVAYVILSVAALLFVVRLVIGPTVPDRVLAVDGLLVTVMCGVLVAAADASSAVGIDTVLVVALLGFIGTGVLARYVEQRGG
jgi:multisubunit Na+/H+ antiporter MnhF subunit